MPLLSLMLLFLFLLMLYGYGAHTDKVALSLLAAVASAGAFDCRIHPIYYRFHKKTRRIIKPEASTLNQEDLARAFAHYASPWRRCLL